jgi:protein-S-isoprenylcysteine O-methyltransferase Ste14
MRLIDKVLFPLSLVYSSWRAWETRASWGSFAPQFILNFVVGAVILGFLLTSSKPQKLEINLRFLAGFLLFRCFMFLDYDISNLVLKPTGVEIWLVSDCCVLVSLVVTYLFIGRSLGIAPAFRKLVNKGPYQLARHPLYGLWWSLFASQVFIFPSLRNIALTLGITVGVWLLGSNEEALLSQFPDYLSYKKTTRFGVFHPLFFIPLLCTLSVRLFLAN